MTEKKHEYYGNTITAEILIEIQIRGFGQRWMFWLGIHA